MDPPVPTILDVAAAARVSTATVSCTLSAPAKVAEATRRRVLKAIQELGYSPNAAAKSLRTLTTHKLVVTVPDIGNPFFSLIIQGIEESGATRRLAKSLVRSCRRGQLPAAAMYALQHEVLASRDSSTRVRQTTLPYVIQLQRRSIGRCHS